MGNESQLHIQNNNNNTYEQSETADYHGTNMVINVYSL